MGQAEQRQVRSGVAERVKRETERSDHERGLLGEVRRHRADVENARRKLAAAEAGLRAAVGLAVLDAEAPEDEAVAVAAGWTAQDVQGVAAELRKTPMVPGPGQG